MTALLMMGSLGSFGPLLLVLSLIGLVLLAERPITKALALSGLLWGGLWVLPEIYYRYHCTLTSWFWFCD